MKTIRFCQTPGIQALKNAHLDIAASIIIQHFAGKESFLVFSYLEGKTYITDGNNITLATFAHRLFSQDVWAVYGEEGEIKYYTFLIPSEY
ncbi:hypothetical protein P8610_18085 [Fictibacillus sp. UD]|uniref:hypothetical protein n=1 Tax=Fictibacillus sp. UD TaxID=3038777 RepID=UPI0037450CC6